MFPVWDLRGGGWVGVCWSEVRRAEVGAETGHREWLYTDLVTAQAATTQQQHQPQQHFTSLRNFYIDGVNSISLISSLNMLEMEMDHTHTVIHDFSFQIYLPIIRYVVFLWCFATKQTIYQDQGAWS